MTDTDLTGPGASQAGQKPRVVLMGEFSAGKSTLSNILLEGAPLPMRVTATRLPPVHISYGAPSARAERLSRFASRALRSTARTSRWSSPQRSRYSS